MIIPIEGFIATCERCHFDLMLEDATDEMDARGIAINELQWIHVDGKDYCNKCAIDIAASRGKSP